MNRRAFLVGSAALPLLSLPWSMTAFGATDALELEDGRGRLLVESGGLLLLETSVAPTPSPSPSPSVVPSPTRKPHPTPKPH